LYLLYNSLTLTDQKLLTNNNHLAT